MANNAHFISNRSSFASGHANRSTRARGTPLVVRFGRLQRIFGLGAVDLVHAVRCSECTGTCRSERGRSCASPRTIDVQRRRRSVQVRRPRCPPTVLSATGLCARLGRCSARAPSWKWSAPPTRKVSRPRTTWSASCPPCRRCRPHRQRAYRYRSRIDRGAAAVRVSQSLRQGGPARTRPVVELCPQRIGRWSVRCARTDRRGAGPRRADRRRSGSRCDVRSAATRARALSRLRRRRRMAGSASRTDVEAGQRRYARCVR